jgi:hypothetical protein
VNEEKGGIFMNIAMDLGVFFKAIFHKFFKSSSYSGDHELNLSAEISYPDRFSQFHSVWKKKCTNLLGDFAKKKWRYFGDK